MSISAWDLVEGRKYVLYEDGENHPFLLLKKTVSDTYHDGPVSGGSCVILNVRMLDGEHELMEAKDCAQFSLSLTEI